MVGVVSTPCVDGGPAVFRAAEVALDTGIRQAAGVIEIMEDSAVSVSQTFHPHFRGQNSPNCKGG